MPIMIEVTTGDGVSQREWDALAAFVQVMSGKAALATSTATAALAPPPPSPSAPAAAPGADALSGGAIAGAASSDEEPAGPEVALAATGEPVVTTVDADAPRDSKGLPWDARIHASTKTTKADGSWTARRGAPAELIAAVEAELKAAIGAGEPQPDAAPAAAPPPPSGGAPAIQAEGSPAAPPPPTAGPVAVEGAPAAAPPPPVEAAAGETVFAAFMRRIVAKQTAGTVTTAMTNEVAVSLGLTSIRDLATRTDLIPSFEALLP